MSGPATISGSTITLTGTGTVVARASQAGNVNYAAAPDVDRSFSVAKKTLTVTADAKSRAYGATNPSFTATITGFVNGETSAVVSGAAALSTPTSSTSTVGSYAITAALGTLSAANYDFSFSPGTLTLTQAPLTVTADTKSRVYGDADPTFSATITGFVNSETSSVVSGAASFSTTATSTSVVGTYPITPTVGTLTATNYAFTTFNNGVLTVGQVSQTITFGALSDKTYGDASFNVSATASSGLSPSFTIVSGPATISGSTITLTGTGTVVVSANQNGNDNYAAATTVEQRFTVGRNTPTIIWATPKAITYGTILSADQFNANASVVGTFVYSPSSGTILSVGTQALTVSFTPSDTANYTSTTRTVALIVGKATPSITWAPPSAITYGMALSETQLNATASVAGSFSYNPSIGTILGLGTQTLSATFTPTDATNYNSATSAVALNVNVALPSAPSAVSATTTNGEATVSFNAPSFTGGATITSYTIRATASGGAIVSVTALGSPAKVTGLTPGKSYRFTVTANNSAGASESSEASDALNISLFNQTITFAAPADRPSNSGSFVLKATASSGLPVIFTILSGPAMLLGNTVDLTGAHGPVKIRASQPGNELFAAAPEVEVTFMVTGGATRVIFSKAIKSSTQTYEADLALVLNTGSRRSTLMIVSNSSSGVRGVVDLQMSTLGMFSVNIPATAAGTSSIPAASSNPSASQASYTITGSLVDNVLTGTVEPLGLTFRQTIAPVTTTTSAIGCYDASALLEERGKIYATVGANNEVLILAEAGDLYAGGYTTLKADNTYTLVTASSAGNVTINGEINPVTTVMKARLTLPTNQVVTYSGLNMATVNTDRLINLSSRAKVGSGEAVLITGFVVGGPEPKRVLVRAVGPALGAFGLNNTLPNPAIKIYQGSRLIAENDDWNLADAAEMASLGAFPLIGIRSKDTQSADAALITTLAPGAYTAQISDSSGAVEGAGVALAEIYDASVNPNADYQRLVNISSRGKVTPDDGVLIGGFIVTGNHPKRLLIRGIGPALTNFGIAGVLTDPSLTIYQDGKVIANNEGWANRADITAAAAQTGAFALPSGSKDAAVLITLNPGAYTAQIKSAKNNSSGVALIEIYEVPY